MSGRAGSWFSFCEKFNQFHFVTLILYFDISTQEIKKLHFLGEFFNGNVLKAVIYNSLFRKGKDTAGQGRTLLVNAGWDEGSRHADNLI